MNDLLSAIFHDLQPDEFVEIRLVTADKGGQQRFFTTVDSAAEFAEQAQGVHVYFGVAPRAVRSGDKSAVLRVNAVWADIDAKSFGDGKAGAMRAATSLVLPPSAIIDSGFGFHVYWFLNEDADPVEAETVMKLIMRAVGGDSVWDASRIMRVPGTLNIKTDPPVQSRILLLRPLRYSLADVKASLQVESSTVSRIQTGDCTGFKSRSERDWSIVQNLVRLGISADTIRVIFMEQPTGDKFRDDVNGEAYMTHTLDRAREQQATKKAAPVFTVTEEGYYVPSKDGLKQASTFTLDPTRLLQGADEDVLSCDISASGYTWQGIQLPKAAFAKRDALQKHLTVAAWMWLGSDDNVRHLLPFLMEQLKEKGLPRAKATSVLGRHGDQWVTQDGVLTTTRHIGSA